jgi:glutathione S-transferase
MVSNELIVYGDYMSQPSRAVFAFCLLNKIPHQVEIISVIALDQYSKEYKTVNPNGKVPAINDNGFKLFESNTILRYLH